MICIIVYVMLIFFFYAKYTLFLCHSKRGLEKGLWVMWIYIVTVQVSLLRIAYLALILSVYWQLVLLPALFHVVTFTPKGGQHLCYNGYWWTGKEVSSKIWHTWKHLLADQQKNSFPLRFDIHLAEHNQATASICSLHIMPCPSSNLALL